MPPVSSLKTLAGNVVNDTTSKFSPFYFEIADGRPLPEPFESDFKKLSPKFQGLLKERAICRKFLPFLPEITTNTSLPEPFESEFKGLPEEFQRSLKDYYDKIFENIFINEVTLLSQFLKHQEYLSIKDEDIDKFVSEVFNETPADEVANALSSFVSNNDSIHNFTFDFMKKTAIEKILVVLIDSLKHPYHHERTIDSLTNSFMVNKRLSTCGDIESSTIVKDETTLIEEIIRLDDDYGNGSAICEALKGALRAEEVKEARPLHDLLIERFISMAEKKIRSDKSKLEYLEEPEKLIENPFIAALAVTLLTEYFQNPENQKANYQLIIDEWDRCSEEVLVEVGASAAAAPPQPRPPSPKPESPSAKKEVVVTIESPDDCRQM